MFDEHHQIGEVTDSVGLSPHTNRDYQVVGLVPPSGHIAGDYCFVDSQIDHLHLAGGHRARGGVDISRSRGER